jgi:hypothetical protein
MMPATYQQPLRHDSHEMYLWAAVNAAARQYKRPIEDLWKETLGMKPILDADVVERGGRLWHTYQDLASDIRRKVIAEQQRRERSGMAARPKPPEPAEPPESPRPLPNLLDRMMRPR